MVDRKARRKGLTAKLDALTMIQETYDHLAKDFIGQSPVVTVENGPIRLTSTPDRPDDIDLIVGLWVRRDDAVTAAQAEDLTDDFLAALRPIIFNDYNGKFASESQLDYAEIGGYNYRVEFHFVQVLDWED